MVLLYARIRSPYITGARKSPVGGAFRSNETCERMATRTAKVDLRRSLSAYRLKRAPVSQLNRQTRHL